jgi:hypothetical protein
MVAPRTTSPRKPAEMMRVSPGASAAYAEDITAIDEFACLALSVGPLTAAPLMNEVIRAGAAMPSWTRVHGVRLSLNTATVPPKVNKTNVLIATLRRSPEATYLGK